MSDKLVKSNGPKVPVRYADAQEPERGFVGASDPREPGVLSEIWSMLMRRKWTLLAGLVLVPILAYVVSERMPRSYQSTVSLLVGSGVGSSSKAPELPGINVLDQLGLPGDIQTELQLLKSRAIVEPIVDKYDMNVSLIQPGGKSLADLMPGFEAGNRAAAGTYTVKAGPTERLGVFRSTAAGTDSLLGTYSPGQKVDLPNLSFQLPVKTPDAPIIWQINDFSGTVDWVRSLVTSYLPNSDASVIGLTCTAGSPSQAQLICKGVSESYVELRNKLQRNDAGHAAEFLRTQSDSVSRELAVAERELQDYQEQHQVVAPETQASSEIQEYANLQARRDELRGEKMALSGFIARVKQDGGADAYRQLAAFPTFINNPMVGDILKNLMGFENQLHELQQRRTEQNPDMIALRARIGELEEQLGRMALNYEDALGRQIAAVDANLGSSRGRLTGVPAKEINFARLQRRRDLLTERYTSLQQQLASAKIAEAVELADVSIIDQASLALGPSSPNVRLNVALGVLAGLLLGLVVALMQEFADTRLRRRGEVERESGLPVLTMIPWVKGGVLLGRSERKLLTKPSSREALPLADYYPARGDLIEAFRSLGADLSFGSDVGLSGGAGTLVFTSPWRGEGKTFSAVNFAATRVLQGYRTLLIDADLRGGSAGAMLGLDHGPGLSDVLAGEVELLDAINMVKVGDHRLAVLGRGTASGDPGNLLEPERVDQILTAAARDFDQVVIDTPPLNLVSDAQVFAACADAVLVVVRSGRTDLEALDVTLSRLGRVGVRPVGIILNDAKLPGRGYAYPGSGYAAADRKAS